jgi:hypothetical protein
MKTKLLCLAAFAVFSGSEAVAQITLDNTNVAPIGDIILQATDTIPSVSIFPGPAGTNQVWNFNALTHGRTDSLVFEVPGWTPYSAPYPSSNIGVAVNYKQYEYLINNASGLYLVGAAFHLNDPGQHLVYEYSNPISKLIQWPASYGVNYTDNYVITGKGAFNQIAGYDSIKIKNTTNSTVTIDAWGSMQTPLGTFPTLRQKRHKIDFDSTWIHRIAPSVWMAGTPSQDTIDSYTWWTNSASAGFPLVSIDQDPNNMVISNVQWLLASPHSSGVAELSNEESLVVYPNPADDYINIQLDNPVAASVAVVDMIGRVVLNGEKLMSNLTRLNIQTLGNGMYFLVITDQNGRRSTRKFHIVR